MQNNIESLNKRIYNYEKMLKDKTIKSYSLHKEKNKTNSCYDFCTKKNENTIDKLDNFNKIHKNTNKNFTNIKNIKAIYPQTFNFKDKKIINIHSPKNDIFHFEYNKNINNIKTSNAINSNFMSSTFNKINILIKKKIKIQIKNKLKI